MEDRLINLLKRYVKIFLNEYQDYLDKEALYTVKEIDYEHFFIFNKNDTPFGEILFNQVYLSQSNDELINNFQHMPNYNVIRCPLNCKNLATYLEYMCMNGYNIFNLYEDLLMYFLFSLVIKNKSFLIKGFINQEIKLLAIKYGIKKGGLYNREERLVSKITPIFKLPLCRKIMFMSEVDTFSYLNDYYGYRYAKLFYDVCELTDKEYYKISKKEYHGFPGLLDFANDYDNLSYVDAYDCILDFRARF